MHYNIYDVTTQMHGRVGKHASHAAVDIDIEVRVHVHVRVEQPFTLSGCTMFSVALLRTVQLYTCVRTGCGCVRCCVAELLLELLCAHVGCVHCSKNGQRPTGNG